MPRITAPTLAEHRDRRRSALLAAGQALVLEGGPHAVTMAAVAQQAGLSRPAVYEYFDSTQDLLAAVLTEQMRTWSADIARALEQAGSPEDRIRSYITASLRLFCDGEHEVVAILSETSLPEAVRTQLVDMHAELSAPLIAAVEDMGATDPDTAVRLIQGVVEAAARRLEPGSDPTGEAQAASDFILAGVRGLSGDLP